MVAKTIKTDVTSNPIKSVKVAEKLKVKNTAKTDNTETTQKTALPVKVVDPKKKRISKGLATHNRKVKQEKRHPSIVIK
jgi:hypothetical protein